MNKMRNLIAGIGITVATALAGCSAFAPAAIPVNQTLSQPAQQAQQALNEANIALTAAYSVLAQNMTDGIYTKAEGQSYLDRLNQMADQTDKAQAALKNGDILGAKTQAELLSKAIVALHREIAAKARAK